MKQYTPQERHALHVENTRWPRNKLVVVPRDKWPHLPPYMKRPIKVMRDRNWLVQIFEEVDSIRLSINRTDLDKNDDWRDCITWDELMELKRQAGYGQSCAIEIYPEDTDIVNVANIRHLWIPLSQESISTMVWTKATSTPISI
jgi:hypothetical protein